MSKADCPLARIQCLRDQIAKELDNVKVQLAKELNTACSTYKVLLEAGATDVFKDPQFAEYIETLGIGAQQEKAPKAPKTGGSKGKVMPLVGAVVDCLK